MSKITFKKILNYLSLTLFLFGVISWIPYLVLNIQEPYGMLTFIFNSIGFYCGYLAKNRALALINLTMLFSFIPVMIYVYLTKGYIPM
ncbi:hypothetical protein [Metabacillus endolithicus]|uniref:Uncharacterized protein n=1 Tax=Metabacillus endolithicus TaxID=1535204 RepID=A0ABW5BQB5_9BACI|nr:hypothetical protein [Metabacillus endolithicus]UPG63810.1 hypothetical protein MVE64_01170 [Metabacillus endolithicus]